MSVPRFKRKPSGTYAYAATGKYGISPAFRLSN